MQQATAASTVPANPIFPYAPPLTFVPNIPPATQSPQSPQSVTDITVGVSQVTLDQTSNVSNYDPATTSTPASVAQVFQSPEPVQSNVNELFASVPARNASPSLIESFQAPATSYGQYAGGIQQPAPGKIILLFRHQCSSLQLRNKLFLAKFQFQTNNLRCTTHHNNSAMYHHHQLCLHFNHTNLMFIRQPVRIPINSWYQHTLQHQVTIHRIHLPNRQWHSPLPLKFSHNHLVPQRHTNHHRRSLHFLKFNQIVR